ncbi:hypothetical protein AVEN_200630-1 [Araneus ventricosus]|uniref:Uncharacterized protein n=1 Tax=Araneus ventricosus TaxID=182803 RepID=A0A4Y2SGK3_ARAVE|nr:hypothetical protein AVEN_200630-1 [Araneus ventricosus]
MACRREYLRTALRSEEGLLIDWDHLGARMPLEFYPQCELSFLINFELSFMNSLYFDFCHSTVFPDFLFIMKRASSESASSVTAAKKLSTFNNTGGFTADSIPQHHYHLGENNYAVVSDFGNVLNVHIRKFKNE